MTKECGDSVFRRDGDKSFISDIGDIIDLFAVEHNLCHKWQTAYIDSKHNIQEVLQLYLSGRHSFAYKKFCEHLDAIDFISNTLSKINNTTFLYRTRIFERRVDISQEELYHIPFSAIENVSNQRYSVAGLPCLYLGSSIFDCWEEMGRPLFDTLMISCYQAVSDIDVIDLRLPNDLSNLSIEQVKIIPYIIASSIQVGKSDKPFKPEYIISQLITEYIIGREIKGIRYSSVCKYRDFNYGNNILDNYVFPTKYSIDEKYDSYLLGLFKISDPTCYEFESIKGCTEVRMGIEYNLDIRNSQYYITKMRLLERILQHRLDDKDVASGNSSQE